MKGTQKYRKGEIHSSASFMRWPGSFLAVVLAAVLILGCGLPFTWPSCAESEAAGTGILSNGGTGIQTQNQAIHYSYISGYPDGEAKPLRRMTREEAAVIFFRLMPEESRNFFMAAAQNAAVPPFRDVDPVRWSAGEIAALHHAKIVQGYEDGSFHPAKPVTRAEFAAMAARFDKLDAAPGDRFPDIGGHWAENEIKAAAEKGWVRAYGDLTFRPENTVLRVEAMMWINDAQDRIVNAAGLNGHAKQWPDIEKDEWYYEIVMEAGNTHTYERIADRKKSTEKWTSIVE